MCHHAWLIFAFLVETGFHHFGQDGLDLVISQLVLKDRTALEANLGPCRQSRRRAGLVAYISHTFFCFSPYLKVQTSGLLDA